MKLNKEYFVTAVPVESKCGGGFVTRKFLNYLGRDYKFIVRKESYLMKLLFQILGFITLPFIHPIFTRYSSFYFFGKKTYANFSQSFGLAFYNKNAVLICHDLQFHRSFKLKKWVLWSEGYLLRRASKVYVLSNRDYRVVTEYYNLPAPKVVNSFEPIFGAVANLDIVLPKIKRLVFIGSLDREENYEAISWFVNNIINGIFVSLDIVGHSKKKIVHPLINYIGFVDDLDILPTNYDLAVAPMFTGQGVKVKVIDCLVRGLPVLGTKDAFSGIESIPPGFVTNDPAIWISIINEECRYYIRS
ncbi:hypothetical protein JCM30760_05890 [Thiomicrorhabdus hydrogeniphila]